MDAANLAWLAGDRVRRLTCHPIRSGAHHGWRERLGRSGRADPPPVRAGSAVAAAVPALRGECGQRRHGDQSVHATPGGGGPGVRLPATLELALYAMALAIAAGVPLGVVAALRRNSWLDHFVRVITVAGLAMAAFWLAILLQLLFSMWLGWTPVQGRIDGWGPDP